MVSISSRKKVFLIRDLKDYRNIELKYYVVANVAIIMCLYGFSFEEISIENIVAEIVKIGLFSYILYVYIFIIDSIIPSQLKYRICYLFIFKQPGCSIFTQIRNGKVDPRFTREDAMTLYADIFSKIDREQQIEQSDKRKRGQVENSAWYRIYSKYRNDDMIFTANRDYLLCRDLCITTVLILIFYLLSCIFLSNPYQCKVLIFLVVEFIFTDLGFWYRGKRLAYNVISLDISKECKCECEYKCEYKQQWRERAENTEENTGAGELR